MATPSASCVALFITLVSLVMSCSCGSDQDKRVYIVYMGEIPKGEFSATQQHMSMLKATVGSGIASESWLHSYTRSFNGFMAKLTEEEKNKIASMEGVVSVFPSMQKQLHTTRSWDFMGFPVDVERATTESDVIVGVLDSGIWPESQSFDDTGFGPAPTKWKGSCQSSANFTCNKYCQEDSLDRNATDDTIVLCDSGLFSTAEGVAAAGAAGAILQRASLVGDVADPAPLPASFLLSADGAQVYGYINTTTNPTATILKSDEVDDKLAPYVVSFSSRGPNPITMDVLQPDVTGPGVNILAAWSGADSVTRSSEDKRMVLYNVDSGTSMSCPHASAAAAYVKSFNPTWSPSAIKSALMTTASPMSSEKNPDAEFAYGSGHINPIKAKSPGLVYDMEAADYVAFLCGQGYSTEDLRNITRDNSTCEDGASISVYDLNYPSFLVSGVSSNSVSTIFHQTVTNVGSPSSTYRAVVVAPETMTIQVEPSLLSFTLVGETQKFVVTVNATVSEVVVSGSLVWDDGNYQVRTPVVAYSV